MSLGVRKSETSFRIQDEDEENWITREEDKGLGAT